MAGKQHHPAVTDVLRHFAYDHLPEHLQAVSKPAHDLAHQMAEQLDGAELTIGLRKLLEAKDCFVRAAVRPAPTARPEWTADDGTVFEPPPK